MVAGDGLRVGSGERGDDLTLDREVHPGVLGLDVGFGVLAGGQRAKDGSGKRYYVPTVENVPAKCQAMKEANRA